MWIKCSDRMPEYFQGVLFIAVAENEKVRSHMIGYHNGLFWVEIYSFYASSTFNNLVAVTHWQALPDYPID